MTTSVCIGSSYLVETLLNLNIVSGLVSYQCSWCDRHLLKVIDMPEKDFLLMVIAVTYAIHTCAFTFVLQIFELLSQT